MRRLASDSQQGARSQYCSCFSVIVDQDWKLVHIRKRGYQYSSVYLYAGLSSVRAEVRQLGLYVVLGNYGFAKLPVAVKDYIHNSLDSLL